VSASGATYVAIITDGNGRWAKQRGLPVEEGHRAGADAVKARLRDAVDLGVRELTVYSFSTENWSRPAAEVAGLMTMFAKRIRDETPELHEEGVRMRFIGRRKGVHEELLEQMRWAEEKTQDNDRITLFVAFNYGGRAEIVDAARSFQGTTEEEFRQLGSRRLPSVYSRLDQGRVTAQHTVAEIIAILVIAERFAIDADDGEALIEPGIFDEVVDRRDQLPPSQIAAGPEDDERRRLRLSRLRHGCDPPANS